MKNLKSHENEMSLWIFIKSVPNGQMIEQLKNFC